jgi:hypothetical protein
MKPAKLLLLDFNPTASPSNALLDILTSRSGQDRIELTRETVRSGGDGPAPAGLLKIISSNRPDVILLVLPDGPLGETRELFTSLECERLMAPLVVVSETGGAETRSLRFHHRPAEG